MTSSVGQARDSRNSPECWPSLPLESWEPTRATLHMWTQIVGKLRLALTPLENHWWNVPLYVSPRGLTTSSMPYRDLLIEIEFDFVSHELVLRKSDGKSASIPLAPKSVADFYREFFAMLRAQGIDVKIWKMPVEIPDPIPFDKDKTHSSYDRESVHKFWRILASSSDVFHDFRALFIGKSSPVHFFWGSFDLAVTRFSGRRAPAKAGADRITQEAYSHEVSSVGFWPGSGNVKEPAYYSYSSPEPAGFSEYRVGPAATSYRKDMGEFLLPYEAVRTAPDPSAALFDFCQTTYEAAAMNAKWPRTELERQ
ncbi:MAG: hypothetical protein JO119_02150 [Acidobacteria bacterium]|nr:hypothetical protein [Acidobacteriota bacterium]